MKMNFAGRLHGIGHALARLPRLIHANEPTFEVPRAPPHRLGELLVAHGRLAATDIEDALRLQEGTEVLFGEVISASGMMCSRDVIEALGANLDIPYAEPNAEDVPLALLQKLPESLAAALEAMPVAILDDGQCVIAMARAARSEETQRLVDVLGGPVRMVLAERNAIRRGRWRAYRRLIEPQRSHQRLGEALITAGALDIAQLDTALEDQLETGEKLGELLVREGVVTAAKVAEELYAPREEYRSVSADDVDILALKLMGYGLASFYEIVPIETPRGVLLACPYPIHPEVTEDIAHRVGQPVTPVLAAGLEVRVALCIASHSTWPDGVCLRVPGFAGAEVSALLDDPMLVAEAAAAARAATELGVSPIDYLERLGRIGHDQAALLRARALGLPPETSRGRDPGALLPPELIDELGIRVMDVDPRGVILAAPQPTPQLAMRVAQLFIERAVAWRVLVAPGMAVAFKEAV